jgi:cytochrome oxidase Cu insertion factor (SCO1/SenC/PrrC family)
VEDRVTEPRSGRPGPASLALLVILLITAAWWGLALWPAGGAEPEWLLRTRAACFGSIGGGLPDAGGWILLIGQPLGMLAVLVVVWGNALKSDLRMMGAVRWWRRAGVGVVALTAVGLASLGQHVAEVAARGPALGTGPPGTPTRVDEVPPSTALVDQHGRRTTLGEFRGRTLLTFAFGHCSTVCPAIVHDLRAARSRANRPEVPVVIVTLDPWRDTPDRLPAIAAEWGLAPNDRVLSGSVVEVERTLDALGVGRRRDESTGNIDHGGTVMILDDRGHVAWRVDGGWDRVGELLSSRR